MVIKQTLSSFKNEDILKIRLEVSIHSPLRISRSRDAVAVFVPRKQLKKRVISISGTESEFAKISSEKKKKRIEDQAGRVQAYYHCVYICGDDRYRKKSLFFKSYFRQN